MATRLASLGLTCALALGTSAAQPDPKKGDEKTLVTKVYNVKPLLGQRGRANGIADADAILKAMFDAIPALRDLKPGTDGPQISERDGGELEVRATEPTHGEDKDLLDALERLNDLAVDVKAEVVELDGASYEKLEKALGNLKAKPPVLFAAGEEIERKEGPARDKALAEASKVLKSGRVVQTSRDRYANGGAATLAARRSVVAFSNLVNGKAAGDTQFVKEGFQLVGLPVVSGDRRLIRFKLTEQSTAEGRTRFAPCMSLLELTNN